MTADFSDLATDVDYTEMDLGGLAGELVHALQAKRSTTQIVLAIADALPIEYQLARLGEDADNDDDDVYGAHHDWNPALIAQRHANWEAFPATCRSREQQRWDEVDRGR